MAAETQESRQAHHRASIKWLISKAFNNCVPDNLKEPFYRDHEQHERLKPQIIVELGNATLYCQTLSNLYSDPNYESLNHWLILQTLSRKGVAAAEANGAPLTETVLRQTNPLKINAHISVIESLMILYAKEISSGHRIRDAIRRIAGDQYETPAQQSLEQALLAWVAHACAALRLRSLKEHEALSNSGGAVVHENGGGNGSRLGVPDVSQPRSYKDLGDGISLALLVAYYCPAVMPWRSVRVHYATPVSNAAAAATQDDAIQNVLLIREFCQKHLPYNVFHMAPEDMTHMKDSVKLNLLVLLSDLFNVFEIHPAKCVHSDDKEPEAIAAAAGSVARNLGGVNEHGIYHRRGLTKQPVIPIPDLRSELETSSSSASPTSRAFLQGFVVHKSRGITTLSAAMHAQPEQKHISRLRNFNENSGGGGVVPQEAKDEKDHATPAGRPSNWEQHSRRSSFTGRRSRRNSACDDSQLTIENFGGSQDQLNTIGHFERERKASNVIVPVEPVGTLRSSVADARGTLQLGYDTDSGSEKQDRDTEKYMLIPESSGSVDSGTLRASERQSAVDDTPMPVQDVVMPRRKVSRNGMSAATPQQQQSTSSSPSWKHQQDANDDDVKSVGSESTKLTSIRLKLEEKRRRIEEDKLQIELALLRHQEREMDDLRSNTLSRGGGGGSGCDGDSALMEPAELEKYQQSVAIMNSNLQDIQEDIQRLANQQNQIQTQNLQAQQMMKLAMLSQTYGSQQHLVEHQQRENFGSTPHLAKQFNAAPPPSMGGYYSRPPSRDSHMSMQPVQQQPVQYMNEHGQYVEAMAPPPSMQHNMHLKNMYGGDNGGGGAPYGKYIYNDMQHGPSAHYGLMQPPGPQYMSRQPDYDDYIMHAAHLHERNSPQSNQFYLAELPPHPAQRQTAYMYEQPAPSGMAWQTPPKLATITDGTYIWEAVAQPNTAHKKPALSHQNSMKGSSAGGINEHYRVYASPQSAAHYGGGGSDGMETPAAPHYRNSSRAGNNMMMPAPPHALESNAGCQLLSDDMMAPQSICFIGDEEDVEEIERDIIESMQATRMMGGDDDYGYAAPGKHHKSAGGSSSDDYDNNNDDVVVYPHNKLNITSGSSTYRIPSPSRPQLHANSFQDPLLAEERRQQEKGFYIAFNDEQPKRPKPPLRAKRSPKKDKSLDQQQPQRLVERADRDTKSQSLSQLPITAAGGGGGGGKAHHTNLSHSNSFKYNEHSHTSKHYEALAAQRQLYADAAADSLVAPMHERAQPNYNNSTQLGSSHSSPLVNARQTVEHAAEHARNMQNMESKNQAIVIGVDATHLDQESMEEMERRKEKIMLLSLQRRQQQEEAKAHKEIEASRKREKERALEESRARKKEEQMARRAAILEQHRLKKAMEEAEREGKTFDRPDLTMKLPSQNTPTRFKGQRSLRPRPKTIHVDDGSIDMSETSSLSSRHKQGSSINLTDSPDEYPSTSSTPNGRGSYKSSRGALVERGRTQSRISVAKGSNRFSSRDRKSNSLMNLCDIDSGLGRATPPRRAPSPGLNTLSKHMSSPSGPGSLPPGLVSKRRGFDDGSSDITPNSMLEYSGPKLYKQPAAKSNRGIILNAVEYCVFPGVVNRDAKQKVLEKIARSEAKHFLILFRDAGCQFRALYSYVPEAGQVAKLYGTGPSQVDEIMFDKFFKYNSGGKCFSQVHTKHLTVTIDAFTIHNSLWQGKKVHLPSKKEMTLVI